MKFQTTNNVIIMLALVVFAAGCAIQRYIPTETAEVVNVSNQDQEAIYNKTRQWFSQYFVSGKSVVDYEDPKTGTIIGNGIAQIGSDPLGIIRYNVEYNIRIDTKDGKFRVMTRIIKHTNTDSKRTYAVDYVSKDREDDAVKHVSEIANSIKNYVTDVKHDSKSDW